MREANRAACTICKRDLDITADGIWQEISFGYLENRSGGGANQVKQPKRVPRWVHKSCAEMDPQEKLL